MVKIAGENELLVTGYWFLVVVYQCMSGSEERTSNQKLTTNNFIPVVIPLVTLFLFFPYHQSLPPLQTAALEDFAPVGGCHPFEESVFPEPAAPTKLSKHFS